MPNVAQVLKQEMKRVVAKEIRSMGLAATVKEQARLIRELQKGINALKAKPAVAAAPAHTKAEFEPAPENLKALCARLGLTQPDLARLSA